MDAEYRLKEFLSEKLSKKDYDEAIEMLREALSDAYDRATMS